MRKVETDFVLVRLAGVGCGLRADCSRKAPTRVGVEPQRSERGGVPRSRDALLRGFCPAVAGHADAWMFNF